LENKAEYKQVKIEESSKWRKEKTTTKVELKLS